MSGASVLTQMSHVGWRVLSSTSPFWSSFVSFSKLVLQRARKSVSESRTQVTERKFSHITSALPPWMDFKHAIFSHLFQPKCLKTYFK